MVVFVVFHLFAFSVILWANKKELSSILESIDNMSNQMQNKKSIKKLCYSVRMGAFPVCGRCFYRKPLRKSRRVLKWFFDNLTGSPDTLNDYADNLTALSINISYYSHCQRENKNMMFRSTQEWQGITAQSVLLLMQIAHQKSRKRMLDDVNSRLFLRNTKWQQIYKCYKETPKIMNS